MTAPNFNSKYIYNLDHLICLALRLRVGVVDYYWKPESRGRFGKTIPASFYSFVYDTPISNENLLSKGYLIYGECLYKKPYVELVFSSLTRKVVFDTDEEARDYHREVAKKLPIEKTETLYV